MVDIIAQQVADNASELIQNDGLIGATQNAIMNAAENVSEALGVAGKAAVPEIHEAPFYADVEFWVGMAFVLVSVSYLSHYSPISGNLCKTA